MASEERADTRVDNNLSGNPRAAVQAGTVEGDVHITVGEASADIVPRQLPMDVRGFVNRGRELGQLDALLALSSQKHSGSPIVISALAGAAGVGKTALAVHWAHRARESFPDGELYVDLHGYDTRMRMTAHQALHGFLHALQVPTSRIPIELDSRAALFRTLLATRKALLVLDNAATAEQVRLLLPGAGHCLVLITSRSRLSGLVARDGASRVTVEHLTSDESLQLLRDIIGSDRIRAEPSDARRLAELCDHLPLALKIVAERALINPHRALNDFVQELSVEQETLDALALDEDELVAVRTVFSWSYRALSSNVSQAFRLLSLHPPYAFTIASTAALTGATQSQASRTLDALTGLHLVQQIDRDHYRMHDLLRSYARERAEEEETDEMRDDATTRILFWYLRTAHAASRILLPQGRSSPLPPTPDGVPPPRHFEDLESALQWCEHERMTLLRFVDQAHASGHHEIAWKLAIALMGFFERRSYWDDWISTHRIGLKATGALGDRFGEGWISLSLAEAYWDMRRFDDALAYFERAVTATRETGDRWGEGFSIRGLSLTYLEIGEYQQAIDFSLLALPIFEEMDERRGRGMCFLSIGQGHQGLGQVDKSVDYYQRALAIFREISNEWSQALATFRLGSAEFLRGELDIAIGHHQTAADAFRQAGDRRHEAVVLHSLGDVHHAEGNQPSAQEAWSRSLALFEDLQDPQADNVREKTVRGEV